LSDGDRILNFKFKPNSVSVTQFLPKTPLPATVTFDFIFAKGKTDEHCETDANGAHCERHADRVQPGLEGYAARPYVLGLFVAAAITSILFVPAAVELTGIIFDWPARMSLGAIARIVTISIIAPLGVGLALRQMLPGFAERLSEPLSRFSTLLLIIGLLPVLFTQGSAAISLIGNGTLLAIAIFVTVGLIAGTLLGGPNASDRTVLSLSTASRHPGVAMAIASTNFPNQKLFFRQFFSISSSTQFCRGYS
jgi:hypothetical protein